LLQEEEPAAQSEEAAAALEDTAQGLNPYP
jgi:hypothetical protein